MAENALRARISRLERANGLMSRMLEPQLSKKQFSGRTQAGSNMLPEFPTDSLQRERTRAKSNWKKFWRKAVFWKITNPKSKTQEAKIEKMKRKSIEGKSQKWSSWRFNGICRKRDRLHWSADLFGDCYGGIVCSKICECPMSSRRDFFTRILPENRLLLAVQRQCTMGNKPSKMSERETPWWI